MSACVCTLMPGINYLHLFGTRAPRLCKYCEKIQHPPESLDSWKFRACSVRVAGALLKSPAAFPVMASGRWLPAAEGLILKRIHSLF